MEISIREVKTETDFKIFYEIFNTIFYKKEDQIGYEYILNWTQKESETKHIILLISLDTLDVGFLWEMVNINIKTIYLYYAGILEEYRCKGIYTKVQILNFKLLKKYKIELILTEPENPNKMIDNEEKVLAIRRLSFNVNNRNFYIISDKQITYLRHYPPAYLDKIQDYYMLVFKPLSKKLEEQIFINGKITKETYLDFYLRQARIELSISNLDELIDKSKAANKFINELKSLPDKYIDIITKDNFNDYIKSIKF